MIHKQYILCKRIIRGYTFNLYCSYYIALLGLGTRFECLLLAVCTEETVFMIYEVRYENYCQAYHKRQRHFKKLFMNKKARFCTFAISYINLIIFVHDRFSL